MDKNVKNVKYELVSSVSAKLKEVLVTYTYEGENYHYYIFLSPKSGLSSSDYLKQAKEKFEAKLETGEVFEAASRAGKSFKRSAVKYVSAPTSAKAVKGGKVVKAAKFKAPKVRSKKRPLIISAIVVGAVAALAVGGFLTYKYVIARDNAEKMSYDKIREYATKHYDEYALDAIPATFTTNLNKMQANIDVNYISPEGGEETFNIAFGFNGIHVVVKDQYAYCLSSGMIDMIEQYYSDFSGLALSLQDEPPIDMNYYLVGDERTKIELTTSQKVAGKLIIKLLQLGTGALDSLFAVTGYLPTEGEPTSEIGSLVYDYLVQLFSGSSSGDKPDSKAEKYVRVIFGIMDYLQINVSDSSTAQGEKFKTYLNTDKYGIMKKLGFIFKSEFNISGLAAYKQYDSVTPKEGDRPTATEPYFFSLKGSVDFDFDISCKY